MGRKPKQIVKSRREQLIDILGDDALDNGDKDGSAPFYEINPNNPQQQRVNPTFKAYKELLQQYTNCYKALFKGADAEDNKEDTPLRAWARSRVK